MSEPLHVVDREIDESWRIFRGRVADWLDQVEPGDCVSVDTDAGDPGAAVLEVDRRHDVVEISIPGRPVAGRYRMTAAQRRRLHELGFRIDGGRPSLRVPVAEVDRAAAAVVVVLHEVWRVVHPSFLDLLVSSELDLALGVGGDAEPDDVPVLPAVVSVESEDALRSVLVRALDDMVEGEPVIDGDGDVRIHGPEGGTVFVGIRGDHHLEVWTWLATEVRFKAAHREADRLSAHFPRFRFFLSRDMLLASATIHTDTLVLQHLYDAIGELLVLDANLSQRLDAQLKHRRRAVGAPSGGTPDDVDPTLLSIAGSIDRLHTNAAVDLLVQAADHSYETLNRWVTEARAARRAAHEALDDTPEGPLKQVRVREWRRWRRTVTALKIAGEMLAGSASHEEAS